METLKNSYLGEEKIAKLLLKFSIPCILSLLVSALYNIVDQIFIGNSELGYLGNAATGIVFPFILISLAFAWCFGDGTAAYLSICQGKNDTQNAHKAVGSSISMTLLSGLLLVALAFAFRDPMLRLFGATDATMGMATEYLNVLLLALPLFMVTNMFNSVIRADGSPGFSMASLAIGAIINIILDPIFIFGLHWGIKGAAYATVIGQVVSFVISALYFTRTQSFRLTLKSFVPRLTVLSHTIALGVSTFITQMAIVVVALVCNIMMVKYGALSVYGPDIPISVISIETKVFTIVINIVVGIILGAQPILGYNLGAKKMDRVRETYKYVLLSSLAVGLISTFFFVFFPQVVIGIFGKGDALYNEFATLTFRVFLSLVTFTCIIKMTSIFFQALGQPVKAAISSLTRDLICFVPLAIILPMFFGIKGILFAAPIADFLAMIVTVLITRKFFLDLQQAGQRQQNSGEIPWPTQPGAVITISREHGSCGKQIGQALAQHLGIPCYYKEMTALAARESGLDQAFISDINRNSPNVLHDLYLSSNVVQQAILAQEQIIQKIANCGSCVIVGRAADYVLREQENVFRLFIHAPEEYRLKRIMEMYGDSLEEAKRSLQRSDQARASYYHSVSGLRYSDARNYDLCIDASQGVEETTRAIVSVLAGRNLALKGTIAP